MDFIEISKRFAEVSKAVDDLFPPKRILTSADWETRNKKRPHQRAMCGFCNEATRKEQSKYDSCPECGRSYIGYKK